VDCPRCACACPPDATRCPGCGLTLEGHPAASTLLSQPRGARAEGAPAAPLPDSLPSLRFDWTPTPYPPDSPGDEARRALGGEPRLGTPFEVTQGEGRAVARPIRPGRDPGEGDEGAELLGRVVAGRYRIERLLGRGGMGRVFAARQLDLERPVALKVLHDHLARDPRQVRRFRREAQVTSQLVHPACVTLHDFGEWEGHLYLAMELLQGESLAERLQQGEALPTTRALEVALQVCQALDFAHQAGVLHRDVKPGNVVLTRGPGGQVQAKVLDFGLALLLGEERDQRLTGEGVVMGTPAYMSPEQVQGLALDGRSDLYSLGVLLYEMLVGQLPFQGTTVSYLVQVLYLEPEPLASRSAGISIPAGVEALVMQCLAKRADDRPASAAEVVQRLESLLAQARRSKEELQRREDLDLGDRELRARAFGLPEFAPLPAPGVQRGDVLLLGLARDTEEGRRLTVALRAQSFTVRPVASLADLPAAAPERPQVLLADLRPAPLERFAELSAALEGGSVAGRPVVVLGPDGDFELMAEALRAGVSGYAPDSSWPSTLPKALSRALRRAQR